MTSVAMLTERQQFVSHAFYVGPKYLAIGAAIAATGLALHWADSGASLVILLITVVPAAALTGAMLGLALFPIAQWIVCVLGLATASWTMAHTLLLGVLGYMATLPFATWVAGGVAKAISGHQGTNLVLLPAAIAGSIAGAMFGAAMRRYAEKSRHVSRQQDSTP